MLVAGMAFVGLLYRQHTRGLRVGWLRTALKAACANDITAATVRICRVGRAWDGFSTRGDHRALLGGGWGLIFGRFVRRTRRTVSPHSGLLWPPAAGARRFPETR